MILDLHLHSELSDDSRAPVEAYLKLLRRKRDERPLDGIVLTEHRQFDPTRDYRALEDQYGFLILTAAEVETDYGHVLVYGVNEDIVRRFDFRNVHLPAQEVITEVGRLGGVALPCHPGRPTVGLCAHYDTKPPLEGAIARALPPIREAEMSARRRPRTGPARPNRRDRGSSVEGNVHRARSPSTRRPHDGGRGRASPPGHLVVPRCRCSVSRR